MGGGKSKQSSSTSQSQVTQSADGVITGKVFNVSGGSGLNFNYVDQFPEAVAAVMKELIALSGDTIDAAGNLVSETVTDAFSALNTTTTKAIAAAQQAAQPDLDLLKQNTKFTPLILGGVLILGLVIAWRGLGK